MRIHPALRSRPRRDGRHPAAASALVTVIAGTLLVAGLAACATTAPTPTSVASPSASASSSPVPGSSEPATTTGPTPVATVSEATPRPSLPNQTDTGWGRIWDALPDGFPRYPGAGPTETGAGPATAVLDVGSATPAEVAGFYRSALERAGYGTLSLSGPSEDGSLELESAGASSCRIRTTVAPLGGTTIVTILYGADCPFE